MTIPPIVVQPVQPQPSSSDAPAILLPVPASVFAERGSRFAHLATDHSLADWLGFLARLSQAQHLALASLSPPALPAPDQLALSLAHGMPPLNPDACPPPAIWRSVLRTLIDSLSGAALSPARAVLTALRTTPDERLDEMAAAVLGGDADNLAAHSGGELCFVAAALQVVWTALAARLDARAVAAAQMPPGVCPCCGSPPVASVVRLAPEVNNLRYLHCSLCNAEWNLTRALCSACRSDQGVALQKIEGSSGAVHAETCDSCKSYLKIMYQEKDPRVDPVADDLATLALDLLLDEAGYSRSGPNLLLFGGSG